MDYGKSLITTKVHRISKHDGHVHSEDVRRVCRYDFQMGEKAKQSARARMFCNAFLLAANISTHTLIVPASTVASRFLFFKKKSAEK